MKSLEEYIQSAALEQLRRELSAIETACEQAVQGGKYGVLVLRGRGRGVLIAAPHPMVPYGNLYEAPADTNDQDALTAAFFAWKPAQ